MYEVAKSADDMDDLILDGYRHVVESGRWDVEWLRHKTGARVDTINAAGRWLEQLRVIERDTDSGLGWRAVSPRVALAKVVRPIEAEARRRTLQAETLRSRLQMLMTVHDADQRSSVEDTIELITDHASLTTLLDEELWRCQSELLVMQSASDAFVESVERLAGVSGRGARTRVITQHSARGDLRTGDLVAMFSGPDMQFRSTNELPVCLILVDRQTCILLNESDRDDNAGEHAAVIRNPLVVSLLSGLFEEVWDRSLIFDASDAEPPPVADEIRSGLLLLLAGGAKDEVIARRLGMSVRTCRRRISEWMKILGATSRFQAGLEAARRNLV